MSPEQQQLGPRSLLARLTELPTLAVLGVVAVGLGAVAFGKWRAGSQCVGVGLLLAAGLRLSLPVRQAGLLVVRSRTVDGVLLLALGFGLVLLATVVPHNG